jgi:hypothetical protein
MCLYPVAQIHTLRMVAWFQMLYHLIMIRIKVFLIRDTRMREAILRVDRRGLLRTILRMFSRVLIVPTTSLSERTAALEKQPMSRNVWWIQVNTRVDGILRSGKRLRYSSTAASALPSQNSYTKCMSQYATSENKKVTLASPYNYHLFTTQLHRVLNYQQGGILLLQL